MLSLVLALAGDPVLAEWSAPASCPDRATVEARVQELLGPDAQPRGHARVRIDDELTARVEIETDVGIAIRSVHGATCDEVVDAVSVIIAVGLDPISVANVVETPPLVEPERSPPHVPDDAVTPVSKEPPPRPRRRPAIALGMIVAGGGELGLLPAIAGTLDGGLTIRRGTLRLSAEAHHGFARRFEHAESTSAGAAIRLTTGRVAVCWAPVRKRVRFPLCLGPEVGAYTASGRGLDRSDTISRPYAALVPEVGVAWFPVPVVGLGVRGQAVVSLTRPRFVIDDFTTDLLAVGAIGARVALTIEIIFFDEDRPSRRRALR